MQGIQFVTNDSGEKTAVLIDLLPSSTTSSQRRRVIIEAPPVLGWSIGDLGTFNSPHTRHVALPVEEVSTPRRACRDQSGR